MKLLKLALLPALLLSGCTTRITDFTVISTKNVDISSLASARRGATRIKGEDVAHIIVLFPTGTPNLKEAIDCAIESVPGAVALVDGVVYFRSYYIPYIYGQSAYVVEGTPLKMPQQASRKSTPKHIVIRYDKTSKAYRAEAVSPQEFEALRIKVQPTPLKA